MNHYDKKRFDVLSHLTDIPLLGKQYVPELWKQIEGANVPQQPVSPIRSQPNPINQRTHMPTTSAQNNNGGRQAHCITSVGGGFEGFVRTTEKRSFPSTSGPSTSSYTGPLSKIPRVEQQW